MLAVQSLYSHRLTGKPCVNILKELIDSREPGEKSIELARELIELTEKELDEVENIIKDHLKNWRWDRLNVIDKSILAVAAVELLHKPDTPAKVIIDEAIEIAKEYSTEKSDSFINGILDAIAKERRLL